MTSVQLSHAADSPAGEVTATAASRLVLSLFHGVGLLDRGFEQAAWTVLRGPDTLHGFKIEDFVAHALRGHLAGVIGGPPCQDFSRARRSPPTGHGVRMLTEFARVVTEAQPLWWMMENVPQVPDVHIAGYTTQRFNLCAADFGLRQNRNRTFQFGRRDGPALVIPRQVQSHRFLCRAVLARDDSKEGVEAWHGTRRNFATVCELQGLPRDFDLPGLSRTAKLRAIGNGVPVPMACAVAVAIRDRGVTKVKRVCICGCGREVTGKQISGTAACRKRIERSRKAKPHG